MATKTKRIQVKTACINCRKKHQGCDNHRPCTRCINSGNEETCKDIPHKRGKPKMTEKQPLSTSGAGGANSTTKKIYTLNDLMTTVEDIVVGKLEEENTPLTMMTINTEDLSAQNSPGVRRSHSTRKYQSKWTHTHFQRPMKKSRSCESVPVPPLVEPSPPIMTWTIPQFFNPSLSEPSTCPSSSIPTTSLSAPHHTPFLPPSLTYNELPMEVCGGHPGNSLNHCYDPYGIIPADYGGEAFDLMVNDGLSLGSPSSEGGSSSDRDVENSGGGVLSGLDQGGWVDPIEWLDLTMGEELFEN